VSAGKIDHASLTTWDINHISHNTIADQEGRELRRVDDQRRG
jgi:hypothetical protein